MLFRNHKNQINSCRPTVTHGDGPTLNQVKINLSLCMPLRHMLGVEVAIFPFLTTTQDGQWSALHPDCFTPDTRYYRTLGGSQSRSGRFGYVGNFSPVQRIERQLLSDPTSGKAQILKIPNGTTRRLLLPASPPT